MKKRFAWVLAIVMCLALLGGCGAAATSTVEEDGRLRVVATIFPYYDFARAVAGEDAAITMLIKPGAESHSYDPSPADILAVQNADVFIYTGGHNDAWAQSILDAVDTGDMRVLRMMDYVNVVEEETVEGMQAAQDDHNEDEDEAAAHADEHIWTSPVNAILLVEAVQQAFAEAAPPLAERFAENSAAYTAALRALDTELHEIVDTAQRNLLVFGDRFPLRYFTDEYGLEYRAAFPGCSTDSNPSAGTVAYLIDTVRDNALPYIYTIELSTGSIARVICEETGCETLTLESCHNVTRAQFEAGETYLSLMQQNAESLRKGLN